MAKYAKCPLEKPGYEQRKGLWTNKVDYFYDYLHGWYEDWPSLTCCRSNFRQGKGETRVQDRIPVSPF